MFKYLLAWGRVTRFDMEVLTDLNRLGLILFLLMGFFAFFQIIFKYCLILRKKTFKSFIYQIKDFNFSNSIKRPTKNHFKFLFCFFTALYLSYFIPTFKSHFGIFTFLSLFFYVYGVIDLSIKIFFTKH